MMKALTGKRNYRHVFYAPYRISSVCCGVVVGVVLLSGSFSMCPTVQCILCSENVYTAHCMKQ